MKLLTQVLLLTVPAMITAGHTNKKNQRNMRKAYYTYFVDTTMVLFRTASNAIMKLVSV